MCSLANYYLNDADEAQSVVQQIFLNVWERKDELLANDNDLKFYLFTSVKNKSFSELKKQKTFVELDDNMEDQFHLPDAYEARELSEKIELLIAHLPNKCRYIYQQSRVYGKSHKQIAEELDLSLKTVENQIGKALSYLKLKIFPPDNQ
jgi:RNA polymerase sigma-70 factor (ECF subfamily)